MGNQRKNRDQPDYSIVEIGCNTERSLGKLALLLSLKLQGKNTR